MTPRSLINRYWKHAKQHYRRKDGRTTESLERLRPVLRTLRVNYGDTAAEDFGPIALKAIRKRFFERGNTRKNEGEVSQGNSRKTVNDDIDRIRRMFKWAVSEQLVAETV